MEPIYLIVLLILVGLALLFFRSLNRSAQKSKKIREFSQALGGQNFSTNMQELATVSNISRSGEKELFDFVMRDPSLSKVLWRRRATIADVSVAYHALFSTGGGWELESGHFIPVSSLMFPATLDYLLNHVKNGKTDYDAMLECTYNLTEYFRTRKVGRVV